MIVVLLPNWHPLAQAAIAFLVTLVPAGLSWHFIEKPAVSWKSSRLSPAARNTAW
jgi:peptidoglycan/LPS O-acetylase OafA/YrhL